MFIESSPAGTQLPGPLNWHHAAPTRLLCCWEKGKDPTLPCFPRISFSRLLHWCQEELHFTSYQLHQIGFVFFFFSELSTPNVDFATYFAGLYHKISFQSSDRKSHWESFLHLVNLTSGVFKGQLQSRWVRLWEHFTNPRVLATLQ